MFVEDIMSKQVHCVSRDDSVGHCRDIFREVHYHHLVVAESNKAIGIVSDRDVLANLSPYIDTAETTEHDQQLLARHVADIMANKVISARPDTLIDTAAILLLENGISCLPVVDDNEELVGIITWKDMLKYYVYAG